MKSFKNVAVYLDGKVVENSSVSFDEKIAVIGDAQGEVINLPANAVVLPGFIDQHIHGAGGSDAMDGTVEDLTIIANTVAAEGTTAFLATTMTQSKENITKAMNAVKCYRESAPATGAELLGIHLEGPFIAEKFKGAQPLEYVVKPCVKTFDEYNEASGNAIKIVSLAPEIEGADVLIKHLKEQKIVPSIGHTGAGYAHIRSAIEAGASNVTHTYNAQTPLHHREIGTVGSALLCDELNSELIADTIHVSVPAMQLLVKCKPEEKVTLITDAMRAKGLADGVSELGGQVVIVKNGEARLQDGTLAGSVLRMNRAVENVVKKVGVPFETAVRFATENPAKNLGVFDEMGSIAVGKKANFAVVDKDTFDVIMTVRNGKIVYQA